MLCKEEYQKRLDAIAQWKAFEVIRRAYHRWSNLRNTRARQLQAKVRRLLVYPEAKQRRDAERYWRVWFGNTERAHDEWSDESDDGQGDTLGGDVRAEDTWSVESDGGEVLS
mmetsp:Transcript_61992/g.146807  ORF Transcript_61992/g.146807 Transcript_61992/m.146807 type:complete len:112 (+) Transcript_61992:77-412(+)